MLPGFPRRVPRGLVVTGGDPACEDGPVPSAAHFMQTPGDHR